MPAAAEALDPILCRIMSATFCRATVSVLKLPETASRALWFQFPEGTDPAWRACWNGAAPAGTLRDGHVVSTVGECVQAVLRNGTIRLAPLAPLGHAWPLWLAVVRLADMAPSRLVVAWSKADANPLIRSFIEVAAAVCRSRPAG